jgi:hypothetical protein
MCDTSQGGQYTPRVVKYLEAKPGLHSPGGAGKHGRRRQSWHKEWRDHWCSWADNKGHNCEGQRQNEQFNVLVNGGTFGHIEFNLLGNGGAFGIIHVQLVNKL